MATQEKKDKPSLRDRLRAKRQQRKQRAAEKAHRRGKDPGDARRDSGVTNTGFGGGEG